MSALKWRTATASALRPSRRLVVSARSVFRMIAAPCVGLRPAPGWRPPGPRRDTPSTDGGAPGFAVPSAVVTEAPNGTRNRPKAGQSSATAEKRSADVAEGGRFEPPWSSEQPRGEKCRKALGFKGFLLVAPAEKRGTKAALCGRFRPQKVHEKCTVNATCTLTEPRP